MALAWQIARPRARQWLGLATHDTARLNASIRGEMFTLGYYGHSSREM